MINIHFLGITGSGASAIAAIAKAEGYSVTGCDKNPSHEFVKNFDEFSVQTGHSPEHLKDIEILIVTPAVYSIDPDNEEIKAAKQKGIEVLTWQEFMGKYLEKDKFVIAVCGTHGKSTVTAMIGTMLEDAGLDPIVELGAIVPRWGANYRISKNAVIPLNKGIQLEDEGGNKSTSQSRESHSELDSRLRGNDKMEIFVTEADEFNDNFLATKPYITVVTNIEMDHPEYFKDFDDLLDSYEEFLGGTKQTIVANLSDEWVAEILKQVMKKTKVVGVDYCKHELNLPLLIPGKFNELNAQAAFQVGLLLGIDPVVIRKSLANYTGIGRRFEHLGSYKGREVYSDFGHHPTEIKTTMAAAREKFPDSYIWLIFQPHMFSRTKGLFSEFVEVFKNLPVNQALIMDIYPSREVDTGLVSSQELVEAVDSGKVDYLENIEELKKILNSEIRPGDIIFFMGAGDIDQMARDLVKVQSS
jgi:UDP-N-acetylmuramate--alanine ligase